MAATKEVECWDDDLELEGPIFGASISTYQNSISSRMSIRSESNAGEEDWTVSISANDDHSTSQAINSAKLAGIPIPSNVPSSALLGGTIRKLGTKKSPRLGKDAWDDDLELPQDGNTGLKLKKREETPMDNEDDDFDWAGGSLGIRHGGLRHASKTISPSFSLRSPSMGSVKTAESEEDGMGGLLLPSGPVDFEAALKKRLESTPAEEKVSLPETTTTKSHATPSEQDDFVTGIDFGTGDVFDTKKRTLNQNLKQQWKFPDRSSHTHKASASITFSDRAGTTRIPRPIPTPTAKPSRLEPVFETAPNNISRARRFETNTTNSQLLRSKRSMPVLRQHHQASRSQPGATLPPHFASPQNRTAQARIPPYGARRDSDPTQPLSPVIRPHSRLSNAMTPETPTRTRRDLAPAALAREAAAKRQVTRPARRRNFGDGTELDTFDDLPTSASKESLFLKQPSAKPAAKTLRSQPSQSRLGFRDRMATPMPPVTPKSPTREDNLPRFARDTAASRIAREQTLGNTRPRGEGPLMPRTNFAIQGVARTPQLSPSAKRTMKKGPTLVAPIGKENAKHWQDDAAKKGMHWNPLLFRWEGNEKAVQGFEATAPPSPPRPALITNFGGGSSTTLVSGNMVFDNEAKRWLKLGANKSNPRSPSIGDPDEDDPFRDIEDLKDDAPAGEVGQVGASGAAAGGEWLVGEEFDVGPEFVRRQQEEEFSWRERIGHWFGEERDQEGERYKWSIRDIAANAAM